MIIEYRYQIQRLEKKLRESYKNVIMERNRRVTYKDGMLYWIPVHYVFNLGNAITSKQIGSKYVIGFDTSQVKITRASKYGEDLTHSVLYQAKIDMNHMQDENGLDSKFTDEQAMEYKGVKDILTIIADLNAHKYAPRVEIPGNFGLRDNSIFALLIIDSDTGMVQGYDRKSGKIFKKLFELVTWDELDNICDVVTYKTHGIANRLELFTDLPHCDKDKIDFHEDVDFTRNYKKLGE